MSLTRLLVISLLLLCHTGFSYSQQWLTEPLTRNDKVYMAEQRERVDDLLRRHFGSQLSGQRASDIRQMQRLLDDKIVSSEDSVILQAMGVVLGELIKSEQGLSWIIYIDNYGRSRALKIPGQRDVLFPNTMISRRVEAGAEVRIEDIYNKAIEQLNKIRQQIIVY